MRTTDLAKVRATLWAAADELRANSKLTPVQYRDPVLGLASCFHDGGWTVVAWDGESAPDLG